MTSHKIITMIRRTRRALPWSSIHTWWVAVHQVATIVIVALVPITITIVIVIVKNLIRLNLTAGSSRWKYLIYQITIFYLPDENIISPRWQYFIYQMTIFYLPDENSTSTRCQYSIFQMKIFLLPDANILSTRGTKSSHEEGHDWSCNDASRW